MKIGILILAAGASRRMGEPKQLLEFAGKTLLRRAAKTALAVNADSVVVVLGANADKFSSELTHLPLEIVVAENWETGMSESLKTGLAKSLELAPDLAAVVLMLCDQPFVTPETIRRLIVKYRETNAPIIACHYNQTSGVPALFAREMFAELLALQGETGARFLIKKYEASGAAEIAAPEASFDVDTKQDYESLLKSD